MSSWLLQNSVKTETINLTQCQILTRKLQISTEKVFSVLLGVLHSLAGAPVIREEPGLEVAYLEFVNCGLDVIDVDPVTHFSVWENDVADVFEGSGQITAGDVEANSAGEFTLTTTTKLDINDS